MKLTSAALLATTTLCAASPAMRMAGVEPCTDAVIQDLMAKLKPHLTEITACGKSAGFNVVPPQGIPTDESAAVMCTKCSSTLDKVRNEKFPDCRFQTDVSLKAVFDKLMTSCPAGGNTGEGNKTEDKTDNKTDDKKDDKTDVKTDDKKDDKTDVKTDDKKDDKTDVKTDNKTDDKKDDKTNEKKDDKKEKKNEEKKQENASHITALSMAVCALSLAVSMAV